MCGIAGFQVKHPGILNPALLDRFASLLLEGIDDRGGDACGYAALTASGELQVQKAAVRAPAFNAHRKPLPADTTVLIMHTRFATQGHEGWSENNHPVSYGPVHVVHNGQIQNDAEIIARKGVVRAGQVDSEAIAVTLGTYGWEQPRKALEALEGGFAIAALNEQRPGELLLARGRQNPLHVLADPGKWLVFASTSQAIRDAWKLLGTPPNWKRFDYLPEGIMLKTDPRMILTRSTFDPLTPAYVSYRTAFAWEWKKEGGWKRGDLTTVAELEAGETETEDDAYNPQEWKLGTEYGECIWCGDYDLLELGEVTTAGYVCEPCVTFGPGAHGGRQKAWGL